MQRIDFKTTWAHPPDVLDLQPHQVDIWRVSLDHLPASVKSLESTLSAEEVQRAARFHFPEDRERYIAAHGGLRDVLPRYLNGRPSQLIFITNDYGKPTLQGYKLEFNLSHSGEIALIALSRERKVGIDVERIRADMELESMARRFFSSNEDKELLALPSELRETGFFNCWTRKEAYIKAQGLGLSLPLDSFDVSLTPGEPAILRATRPDAREGPRWALQSLNAGSGYAAAIAVEVTALSPSKGKDLEFRLWHWNPRKV